MRKKSFEVQEMHIATLQKNTEKKDELIKTCKIRVVIV